MGQATSQIAAHIEDARADLGDNLHELEQRVRNATDWRQQFRDHPMTMVGVAFGGGVMLAAMLGGRKGRAYSTPANSAEPYRGNGHTQHKTLETLDTIKDALFGVAATRIKNFVGEIVPGFNEELQRCEEKAKASVS